VGEDYFSFMPLNRIGHIYGCMLPGRGGAKGGGQGPGPHNAPINTNLALIKSKKSVKNLEN
jgi:hypothetical protein